MSDTLKFLGPVGKVLLTIFAIASSFSLSFAQTAQTAAKPDRGGGSNSSYALSDIENINLENGNVNISIPLASLPPIAGGKLGFTLRAIYNSKLFDTYAFERRVGPGEGGALVYVNQGPRLSELGGWRIGARYAISAELASNDFARLGDTGDPDLQSLSAHSWQKTFIITPDGSRHELRPLDYFPWNGNNPTYYGYYKDGPGNVGGPVRYYSFDGSFLWAKIYPSGSSLVFEIYQSDGTKITEWSDGIQRISDTNGNSIKIFTDGEGFHYQDEQTGREIKYTVDSSGVGHVSYQTVGGTWVTTDISFRTTSVRGKAFDITKICNPDQPDCTCTYQELYSQDLSVIQEIVLPQTEPGMPRRKFTFTYNSDISNPNPGTFLPACFSNTDPIISSSYGNGQLSQMETPSGVVAKYSYSLDGTNLVGEATTFAEESIISKQVIHDGTTDNWAYVINGSLSSITNPDGSTVSQQSYYHSPAHLSVMGGSDGLAGLVYRINRSNKLLIERHWTRLKFDGARDDSPGGKTVFNPVVDAEYTTLLDDTSNHNPVKMSARTYQYDYNGNLLQQTDYDWFDPASVSRDISGVPTGVPSGATVLRTVSNSYYNSAASSGSGNVYAKRALSTATPLILSALQQTTTGPGIAQFSYDGNSYGAAPTVGNLTSKSVYDDVDDKWITTSTAYNSYGNVTSATDARGKVTYFYYDDSTHAAPTRVVVDPQNGTGTQTATTVFDFSTGLVTSTTDPNNNTATIDYTNQLLGTVDPFGRPGVAISPLVNAGGANQHHRTKTFYEDSARTVTVTSDFSSEGDGLLKSQAFSDQLGRTIESRQYEGGTNYTVTKTQYDSMGRAFKSSNPYRPWQSETAVWTTSAFDILGRVISITTPDNAAVSTAYSYNTVTVTDQAGKQRRSVSDSLGRLIQVYEDPNGLNYQTSYDYDVFGNLRHVYQDTQTRTFTYDSLSRLRTAANPEIATITYTYDDNSNLTNKTDARGIVSTYVYDALNRATSRSYSDSTPAVTYAYDSATISNGKGLLASVSSSVSTYSYSGYDAMGRVNGGSQTISGQTPQTYSMSYTYDLAGHVLTQTYPSGRIVTNAYDSAGRTSGVTGNLGDGTQRTYATGISYSPFGGIAREQYGTTTPLYHKTLYNIRGQMFDTRVSSVNDTWDWNRGRLIWYYSSNHAWGGSGTDNNGNVMFAENWVPPPNATLDQAQYLISDSYTYDALNRLSAVNESSLDIAGGGSWTQQFVQSYDYDRYGNRTINPATSGVNATQFDKTDAQYTNRLYAPGDTSLPMNQRQMRYDNAGNQTHDNYTGQGQRTFDAESRIIAAQGGVNASWQYYSYDGDGRRVKRSVNSTETWQVYGLGGELVAEYAAGASYANPEKEYGYRNGQLLITTETGTTSAAAPSALTATPPTSGASITLNWSAASGASNYRIERQGTGGSFTLVGTTSSTTLTDGTTTSGNAYLYKVCAANGAGNCTSGYSNVALGAAVTFPTDPTIKSYSEDPANATSPKAAHITELRTAVNALRSLAGLSTITAPNPSTGDLIGVSDVRDLRTKLGEALTTLGIQTPSYTDATLKGYSEDPLNATTIRAAHIRELRQAATNGIGGSGGGGSSFQIRWLVADTLGTPRMIFDQTGALANVSRHDYLPFGEELFAGTGGLRSPSQGYTYTDGARQKFTSKERDSETGLDFFEARYYASMHGRFTSPDEPFADQSADNPQSWNLYSYVRNNPLVMVDPTGRRTGDYYYQDGTWSFSDGINDNKVYALNQTNDPDGSINLTPQLLNITHTQFRIIANIVRQEAGTADAQESLWIAHTSSNEARAIHSSLYDLLQTGFSSADDKVNGIPTNDSSDRANAARAGVIDVLAGGHDPTGGARRWDGTDFLAWGLNGPWGSHAKFRQYTTIDIAGDIYRTYESAQRARWGNSITYYGTRYTIPAAVFTNTANWTAAGDFHYVTGARNATRGLTATGARGQTIFWRF